MGDLLRQIGHKLECLNEYGRSDIANEDTLKEVSYQVQAESAGLWLDMITILQDVFRNASTAKLTDIFSKLEGFIERLDVSVKRVKDLVELAANLRGMEQIEPFEKLQQLVSVGEAKALPCYCLPAARNPVFYGRETELSEVELKLARQSPKYQTASVAIYGLGGVGKTQVALHYAWNHLNDFDVVLWFNADTEKNLQSSFGDAAVRLQLHTDLADHVNSRTRLLVWLQKTSK